jgi:hypothetical protein
VVEIVPDHGLRQFFGITPGTPGELRQLFLLFRTKVHDHTLQSRKACSTPSIAVNPENWTSPAKFASILTCEFKQPFNEHYPY